MKRQVMRFAATVLFLSVPYTYAQQMNKVEIMKQEKRQKVLTAYVSSLILSGCIGATTGGIVRYLEKKFNFEACPIGLFLTFLAWALESELRNDIIIALQKDLDDYEIGYKRGLMFKGAWIASWISYLNG